MIDRLIIISKNRDFPRLGDRLPATVSGVFEAGKGGSATLRGAPHQYRHDAGIRPISGTDGHLSR